MQEGKRLIRFTAASLRTSGSFLRGGSEFFLGERSPPTNNLDKILKDVVKYRQLVNWS
ncbi:MAG: hypothetical protein F6K35_25610 [Okeania sp. SIO2H7]|nr:hypothetical protein [Okeania sp. SIO2H7]